MLESGSVPVLTLFYHRVADHPSNDWTISCAQFQEQIDWLERRFDIVDYAFLELAEPLIPDGIEQCLQKGAQSVRVLPYFLARGTHVVEDIPEQVAIKQKQYPDMDIHITPYLGTVAELPEVLLTLAE